MATTCPACGAELRFQSSASIMATCSFCQSLILRTDMNLHTIGKSSDVAEDMSVIQLGSQGKYANSNFMVVGRIQMKWSGGFWNEWFITFDDGRQGWLADAQGSLMISFADPRFKKFPQPDHIELNQAFKMSDLKTYYVKDIKQATVHSILGELPFSQQIDQEKQTFDLSCIEGNFATLDYDLAKTKMPVCYLGSWQTVQSLQLSSLRQFEGWPLPAGIK